MLRRTPARAKALGQEPGLGADGELTHLAERSADGVEVHVEGEREAERRGQRDAGAALTLELQFGVPPPAASNDGAGEVADRQPGAERAEHRRDADVGVDLVARLPDQVAGIVQPIVHVAGRRRLVAAIAADQTFTVVPTDMPSASECTSVTPVLWVISVW